MSKEDDRNHNINGYSHQMLEEEEKTDNESHAHPLLSMLSFLLAVILLISFFSPLLDGMLKLLMLGGVIIFFILGVLLREKRLPLPSADPPTYERPTTSTDEQETEPTPFEQLVREALDAIPPEFQDEMDNLVVLVEDEPDEDLLEKLYETDEAKEGRLLLGLYQGVPLTHQSYSQTRLPERITIYQRPIERYCHDDPERIRDQVHSTVLHEVAHHFGMDHHDMPIWVR